jgi:energy-coupling factor transporter ATP-binding protein EcfA2
MPVPQRQSMRPPLAKKQESEYVDPWGSPFLKVLLYGESGSGKTTLASTADGPIRWLL